MQAYAAMLDELEAHRSEFSRVRDTLAQLTSRATSADRLVAVTVNGRGLAVDISIEPAALRRHRADALSQLLTTLIAEADTALRTRRAELLAALPEPTVDYADAALSDTSTVPEADPTPESEAEGQQS